MGQKKAVNDQTLELPIVGERVRKNGGEKNRGKMRGVSHSFRCYSSELIFECNPYNFLVDWSTLCWTTTRQTTSKCISHKSAVTLDLDFFFPKRERREIDKQSKKQQLKTCVHINQQRSISAHPRPCQTGLKSRSVLPLRCMLGVFAMLQPAWSSIQCQSSATPLIQNRKPRGHVPSDACQLDRLFSRLWRRGQMLVSALLSSSLITLISTTITKNGARFLPKVVLWAALQCAGVICFVRMNLVTTLEPVLLSNALLPLLILRLALHPVTSVLLPSLLSLSAFPLLSNHLQRKAFFLTFIPVSIVIHH